MSRLSSFIFSFLLFSCLVLSLLLCSSFSVSLSLSPCGVWCVRLCCGTLKKTRKNRMWIPTRICVSIPNVLVYAAISTRTCVSTCVRGAGTHGDVFECAHGGVLDGHTEGFFNVSHYNTTTQDTTHNTGHNTRHNTTREHNNTTTHHHKWHTQHNTTQHHTTHIYRVFCLCSHSFSFFFCGYIFSGINSAQVFCGRVSTSSGHQMRINGHSSSPIPLVDASRTGTVLWRNTETHTQHATHRDTETQRQRQKPK